MKQNLRALLDILGNKLLSRKNYIHHIRPITIPGKKHSYNSHQFWNSWYKSISSKSITDSTTISHNSEVISSKYHYNAIENSIINALHQTGSNSWERILDIGSGAGHWIDFYLKIYKCKYILGVDISELCISNLEFKYFNINEVEFRTANIAKDEIISKKKFNLINAIGVMFHIVDDLEWEHALKNISTNLEKGGFLLVGGDFTSKTKNLQFHQTDSFDDIKDYQKFNGEFALVNKRIRSLRLWKTVARKNDMEIVCLFRTSKSKHFFLPENNILLLTKTT